MASILIVDDEKPVRDLLRTSLERTGHSVHEAPDGEIALESFRERHSDLVITDLVMPRMGGLALIQRLLAEFPSVKIIALSAFPDELTEARRLGAHCAEAKPFSPSKLCETVNDILGTAG